MRCPAAHREQRIDGAHAHIQGIADRTPQQGVQRLAGQGHPIRATQFPHAVERASRPVEHPAEEFVSHRHRAHAARRNDPSARHDAADIAGRHQKQLVAREADDFRLDLLSLGGVDQTAAADGRLATDGLQRHPDHAAERALDHEFRCVLHALARLHERFRPSFRGGRARRVRRAHAPLPREPVPWRSVPMSSLNIAPRRVSSRASTRDVAVVIWQPPRAMTGSSTSCQARSLSVGARF